MFTSRLLTLRFEVWNLVNENWISLKSDLGTLLTTWIVLARIYSDRLHAIVIAVVHFLNFSRRSDFRSSIAFQDGDFFQAHVIVSEKIFFRIFFWFVSKFDF